MKISQMSDSLSISPQVEVADLPTIAELGFQAIIINRPDGEGKDQPSHHDIARAAEPLGPSTYYVPVIPSQLGQESVEAFATVLEGATGPTLAHCKSGMRSRSLWEKTRPISDAATAGSLFKRLKWW